MTDLLLDTHVVLWLNSSDERLGEATRRTIDTAWKAGGRILISSVSVCEIAILVDKGFIELDLPVNEWVASAIGLGCPLVTRDDRIRRFAKTRGRQYRFAIA